MTQSTWFIQCILALIFFSSGSVILIFRQKLEARLSWLRYYSLAMVYFICCAKMAAGIALALPLIAGFGKSLVPAASAGLALLMLLAAVYHLRRKEYKDMPATLVFLVLALFVTTSSL